MTTTTGITHEQVTADLRKMGFKISSTGSTGRIGLAKTTDGFSVTANGERVSTCRTCHGRTHHKPDCKNPSGSAKNWRRRIEMDGTVTVRWESAGSGRPRSVEVVREERAKVREAIVTALTEAGYTVTEASPTSWVVSA